jgi:hypothetical protein
MSLFTTLTLFSRENTKTLGTNDKIGEYFYRPDFSEIDQFFWMDYGTSAEEM